MVKFTLFIVALFCLYQNTASADDRVCTKRICYYLGGACSSCYDDPDVTSDVPTLIERYGYDVETHEVLTKDGYILTLYRVMSSSRNQAQSQPVLLVHIALGSSAAYVVSKNNSLAFVLADAGYDVWLANLRGSQYSQEHFSSLTVEDNEYWDYSIDEMAENDVPAYLDVIENITGQKGVIYVGHSISTSMVMAYSASHPKKAKKRIKLAVLFSETVELRNTLAVQMQSTIGLFGTQMWQFIDAFGINKYLSAYKYQRAGIETLKSLLGIPLLFDSFVNMFGPNTQITIDQAPVFLENEYVGLSMKAYIHALHFTVAEFAMFDYGAEENMYRYGNEKPPVYNVSKIQNPVYIVNAPDDYFASEEDAQNLYEQLSDEAKKYGRYTVPIQGFNHLAYAYGKDAKTVLYDHLVELFDSIE